MEEGKQAILKERVDEASEKKRTDGNGTGIGKRSHKDKIAEAAPATKGQLALNDVGVRGSASKVIKRPEIMKDTEKQTSLKEIVGKGSQPKTISAQEAPTTDVAPKLGNKSSK